MKYTNKHNLKSVLGGNTMRSHVFVREDFRSFGDGYHLEVWDDVCETFNLDPDKTDSITLRLTSWEIKDAESD